MEPNYIDRTLELPLDYLTDTLFAGQIPDDTQRDTRQHILSALAGVYTTAKDIQLQVNDTLPWQMDTEGKLYSTPLDQDTWRVRWLEQRLGINYDTKEKKYKPISKEEVKKLNYKPFEMEFSEGDLHMEPVKQFMIMAATEQLLALRMQGDLLAEETQFRKDMINWIMGKGGDNEYEDCWWVQDTKDWPKNSEEQKQKIVDERAKLVSNFPWLTRGVIEKVDFLPVKARVFLRELHRKAPRTDEECYLWYKYFVRKMPINFDHVFAYEPFYKNNKGPPKQPYRRPRFYDYTEQENSQDPANNNQTPKRHIRREEAPPRPEPDDPADEPEPAEEEGPALDQPKREHAPGEDRDGQFAPPITHQASNPKSEEEEELRFKKKQTPEEEPDAEVVSSKKEPEISVGTQEILNEIQRLKDLAASVREQQEVPNEQEAEANKLNELLQQKEQDLERVNAGAAELAEQVKQLQELRRLGEEDAERRLQQLEQKHKDEIEALSKQLEEVNKQKAEGQIKALKKQHKKELEARLNRQKKALQERQQEALARVRLEGVQRAEMAEHELGSHRQTLADAEIAAQTEADSRAAAVELLKKEYEGKLSEKDQGLQKLIGDLESERDQYMKTVEAIKQHNEQEKSELLNQIQSIKQTHEQMQEQFKQTLLQLNEQKENEKAQIASSLKQQLLEHHGQRAAYLDEQLKQASTNNDIDLIKRLAHENNDHMAMRFAAELGKALEEKSQYQKYVDEVVADRTRLQNESLENQRRYLDADRRLKEISLEPKKLYSELENLKHDMQNLQSEDLVNKEKIKELARVKEEFEKRTITLENEKDSYLRRSSKISTNLKDMATQIVAFGKQTGVETSPLADAFIGINDWIAMSAIIGDSDMDERAAIKTREIMDNYVNHFNSFQNEIRAQSAELQSKNKTVEELLASNQKYGESLQQRHQELEKALEEKRNQDLALQAKERQMEMLMKEHQAYMAKTERKLEELMHNPRAQQQQAELSRLETQEMVKRLQEEAQALSALEEKSEDMAEGKRRKRVKSESESPVFGIVRSLAGGINNAVNLVQSGIVTGSQAFQHITSNYQRLREEKRMNEIQKIQEVMQNRVTPLEIAEVNTRQADQFAETGYVSPSSLVVFNFPKPEEKNPETFEEPQQAVAVAAGGDEPPEKDFQFEATSSHANEYDSIMKDIAELKKQLLRYHPDRLSPDATEDYKQWAGMRARALTAQLAEKNKQLQNLRGPIKFGVDLQEVFDGHLPNLLNKKTELSMWDLARKSKDLDLMKASLLDFSRDMMRTMEQARWDNISPTLWEKLSYSGSRTTGATAEDRMSKDIQQAESIIQEIVNIGKERQDSILSEIAQTILNMDLKQQAEETVQETLETPPGEKRTLEELLWSHLVGSRQAGERLPPAINSFMRVLVSYLSFMEKPRVFRATKKGGVSKREARMLQQEAGDYLQRNQ